MDMRIGGHRPPLPRENPCPATRRLVKRRRRGSSWLMTQTPSEKPKLALNGGLGQPRIQIPSFPIDNYVSRCRSHQS